MSAHFILGRHKLTNEPTYITAVNLTDKHEFICLDCGKQLTCVLNVPTKTKHFKHRETGCNATSETLLHLTVKEILTKHNKIKLPNGSDFEYTEALPEKKWDKYRPDVTLKSYDKTLYVEVIVSHPISSDKHLSFGKNLTECLIIDLREYSREFDIEQLREDVLESLEYKSMLFQNLEASKATSNNDDDFGFLLLLGAIGTGIIYVTYEEFIKPRLRKYKRRYQ